MKKTLLILLCLSMSYFLMAQEKVKQKEVGLVFSDLYNFGLTYKTGTDKSLWRFNSLFISGGNMEDTADSLVSINSNSGFGVKVGKEYRKKIADNLELRFGADLSFRHTQYERDRNDKTVYDHDTYYEEKRNQSGVNLVFGFNYVTNQKIVIGAELLPGFYYVSGKSVDDIYYVNNGEKIKSDISGFNYGLSSTSARLSVAYRF